MSPTSPLPSEQDQSPSSLPLVNPPSHFLGVSTLDLRHSKLSFNSDSHVPFPEQINALDLSHNNIRGMPKDLCNLPNLTHFSIAYNAITSLPHHFASSVNLVHIDVSHNRLRLSRPPRWFLRMGRVGSIILAGNPRLGIERWPQYGVAFGPWLRRLRRLDVSGCGIKKGFPVAVFGARDIVKLQLGDNSVCELPEDLSKLRLTQLELPNIMLSALPDGFGALIHLRRLNLSHNLLYYLPDAFINLQCLEYINLSSNNLESLPFRIETLPRLSELQLAHNSITWIPEDFAGLAGSLKCLDLYGNRLDVPGMVEPLERLLAASKALIALDVAGNDVSQVEFGPLMERLQPLQKTLRSGLEEEERDRRRDIPEEIPRMEEHETEEDDDEEEGGNNDFGIEISEEDFEQDEDFDEAEGRREEEWSLSETEDREQLQLLKSPVKKLEEVDSADEWDGVVKENANQGEGQYDWCRMGQYYQGRFRFCPSDDIFAQREADLKARRTSCESSRSASSASSNGIGDLDRFADAEDEEKP